MQHVLTCPKFSPTPWNFDIWQLLLDDDRLHKYVKVLEFGPELLNKHFENALGQTGTNHIYGDQYSSIQIAQIYHGLYGQSQRVSKVG
jgi:hypothetical protein